MVKMADNLKQFDYIIKDMEKEKIQTVDSIERNVLAAALILKKEIQLVISEYNSGQLAREGKPAEVGALVETGFLWTYITADSEKTKEGVKGIVTMGAEYAAYLNDGTKDLEGNVVIQEYRFVQIAFKRCEPKIKKIMGDFKIGFN